MIEHVKNLLLFLLSIFKIMYMLDDEESDTLKKS